MVTLPRVKRNTLPASWPATTSTTAFMPGRQAQVLIDDIGGTAGAVGDCR